MNKKKSEIPCLYIIKCSKCDVWFNIDEFKVGYGMCKECGKDFMKNIEKLLK